MSEEMILAYVENVLFLRGYFRFSTEALRSCWLLAISCCLEILVPLVALGSLETLDKASLISSL